MTGSGTAGLRVTAAQVEVAKLAIELRTSLGEPVNDRLRLIASATPVPPEDKRGSRVDDFPVDSWIDAPDLGGVGVVMRHVDNRLRVLFMASGYKDVDPDSGVSPATPPDLAAVNEYLRSRTFDSTGAHLKYPYPYTDRGSKFRTFISHGYDTGVDHLHDADGAGLGYGYSPEATAALWRTGVVQICRAVNFPEAPWIGVSAADGHVSGVWIIPADFIDESSAQDDPSDRPAHK
jgi:hypothetical protein